MPAPRRAFSKAMACRYSIATMPTRSPWPVPAAAWSASALMRPPVAEYARHVLLIGRDAPLIEAALAGLPLERCASLEEAVARAAELARPGDAVLLSPACASFDMFRDYKQRGEVFAAAVRRLP